MKDPIEVAGCVLTDPYGRILLIHRNRSDYTHWEVPGGKVEPGEAPVMAALREIKEELGVDVDIRKALGNEVFEVDGQAYKYHWFLAVVINGVPDVMEADTFDDLDYFDIEDFPSLALSAGALALHQKLLSGEVALEQ